VKLVDISGKIEEYLKAKIEELETNSENKNIWGLYRIISECKESYTPSADTAKTRMVILLQTATIFCWVEESFLSVIEFTWG